MKRFLLGVGIFLAPVVVLAEGTHAAIRIEQVSPAVPGAWTFLAPDGTSRTGTGASARSISFSIDKFGPMTLSTDVPAGMSVRILVYRRGEIVETIAIPQVSFELFPNDDYRFVLQYSYSRLGSLGLTSIPGKLRFRMKGSSGRVYTGTTPKTLKNLPEGRYTIYFNKTRECVSSAPHNLLVKAGERNTTTISLMCEDATGATEVLRDRPTKRSIVNSVFEREEDRAATHR